MQSGAGQFIAPAAAGLAGAASPAGAQMMMQGVQQVVAMEAQNQLAQGLRDAMGPTEVPPAADAESAVRSTPESAVVQEQRRVIDAMLQGGDVQGAITMYKGLADMMNTSNKPLTVAPGHSVYQGGTFSQAPGTWGVEGGHPVHSTQGVWDEPTAIAEGELAATQRGLDIDQQRADAYTRGQEASAMYNDARTVAEGVKDGGRFLDPILALSEFVHSAEGQLMKQNDPDQYNKYLAYLQHYDVAWREATGANPADQNANPGSTQEGYGSNAGYSGRLQVQPDGSYNYIPSR
jgi:hypothetical protein